MDMRNRVDISHQPKTIVHFVLSCGLVAALCLSGCASPTASVAADSFNDVGQSVTAETVAVADTSSMDFEYTDRDIDATYDDASATHLVLSQAGTAVDGAGVVVDGSTATITEEGTYVVSGELTDGQLVVETEENMKVQVVLAGVAIHNEDGPAIYIKQTDKAFLTLAKGTENTLTDGAEYALEEDSDEPYATLFSNEDLTLNGAGTLSIVSAYRHAICSKDDLVIAGGTYEIDAVEDALRGRDCVKICGGIFSISAIGDGIKSNRDDDAARGFVSIDGGTFEITAGDDGVQAETLLRVADGSITVEAIDDAMHSNGEAEIQGGTTTLNAGDDAVHAEAKLTVSGGFVDIRSCYEGYEAEKIYLNGGETHLVAADDALNASAAETETAATASSDTSASGDLSGGAPAEGGNEGAAMPGGEPPTGGEGINESQQNGGKPMGGMAEGGAGMGNEDCLIQVNGGYTVIEAGGDGIDSNGSFEMTDGVLLVSGPTDGSNGAFDYDLSATIAGGTMVMVGSTGMAQNLTSGEQPFSLTTVSGNAGQNVAITDDSGTVIASYTPTKQFGMVIVSSPSFVEGGTYQLVVGGAVSDANGDGYAEQGVVSGGSSTTSITASTTAASGMGGLGSDGMGKGPGMAGQPQGSGRGAGRDAAASSTATSA